MDLKHKLVNHYKRWNIDLDEEKQFIQFKNRIIIVIDEFIGQFLTINTEIDRSFSRELTLFLAEEPRVKSSTIEIINPLQDMLKQSNFETNLYGTSSVRWTERGFGDTAVYKAIKNTDNLVQLVTVIQVLLWILEKYDKDYQIELGQRIRDVVTLTPSINYSISVENFCICSTAFLGVAPQIFIVCMEKSSDRASPRNRVSGKRMT
jgi:hypothetical protein